MIIEKKLEKLINMTKKFSKANMCILLIDRG